MRKKKTIDQAATMGGEIRIEFEPGRMLFCIEGGPTFFMSAETACGIFGDQIRGKFDQEDPADILELFVFIERALQKGMTLQDVAKARDMDPATVREFYSRLQSMPNVRRWDAQQHAEESRRQAIRDGDGDGLRVVDVGEILNPSGTRHVDPALLT